MGAQRGGRAGNGAPPFTCPLKLRLKWIHHRHQPSYIMVNIYLNVDGSPVSLLTIPNSEAERLSIRPFKWLRYVMYSICGARGDLSATPDGPSVAYNTTSLADVIDLYYNPSGEVYFLYVRKLLTTVPISPGSCIFVDYEGLNDQITSTDLTPRRSDFRNEVIKRDGLFCVITRLRAGHCDAAHLIPRSKADEVMFMIVLCDTLMMVCYSTL